MTKKEFSEQYARARDGNSEGEVVAKDAMHTVRRSVHVNNDRLGWFLQTYGEDPSVPSADELGPVSEELQGVLAVCEDRLTELGWPSPAKVYEVKNGFLEEVEFPSFYAFSRIEVLEHGCSYILERAKPDSEAFWLAQICNLVLQFFDEPDPHQRSLKLLQIGQLRSDLKGRLKYLPALQKSTKSLEALLSDPDGNRAAANEKRKTKAAKWHSFAIELAKKYWEAKPEASISQVSDRVLVVLKKEGRNSADGSAPSKERVRKVISKAKPTK